MKQKTAKNKRDKLWIELEEKIQKRANQKEKTFVLIGKWKRFVREEDGFKIFAVDGEWVRNNLSVIFGHGGHGYVHEFIPLDEIWVATCHFEGCGCLNVKNGQKMSGPYFESTVLHEISEFKEMKKGINYWQAHQIALKKEKEAGILKDVNTEVD